MVDGEMPEWAAEFERCAPWIEAALEHAHGTHTLQDVADLIAAGNAQLWPGKRSAVVTEICQSPRMRYMNIWLAGGELDELEDITPCLEAWGMSAQCERVTLCGRRGWERTFLKDRGYAPQSVVFAKDLGRCQEAKAGAEARQ